ncbi:hypothetical protein ACWF95_40800, partial [Streptomyces vinaceus]
MAGCFGDELPQDQQPGRFSVAKAHPAFAEDELGGRAGDADGSSWKKTGEAPVPGVFQAPGPLELARSRHEDKWTAPWNGAMESVQTYASVLSPAQI